LLNQNHLDWFAARLSIAVYDTNQEYRLGIVNLKEQLAHIPGINNLTMQYGQGTEIYTMGDIEVEVPAMATPEEIAKALANPFDNPKKKLSN
jgi:hypothetical protein